jgi:hypothetical protein
MYKHSDFVVTEEEYLFQMDDLINQQLGSIYNLCHKIKVKFF